jgi:hypothetical protein
MHPFESFAIVDFGGTKIVEWGNVQGQRTLIFWPKGSLQWKTHFAALPCEAAEG